MSAKSLAIKRINKEIKEIISNPVEGIGITSLDNDPMKYIVNICLMSGIYKGYCVQLFLTFPDNYPIKPPKILIFPNQGIDHQYNYYIYPDNSTDENGQHFKNLCYGENSIFAYSYYKWNPSYSISSLLIEVQNFIGDSDFSPYRLNRPLDKIKIEELMKSMEAYKKKFIIKDENGEKEIIHTWKNPYPEMFFKTNNNNNSISIINNQNNETIKENLTCSVLKSNYIDEPEIILGYPIIQIKGLGKDKYDLYPIPELMTFDGFLLQIGNFIEKLDKLDNYYTGSIRYGNNGYYNYWVPIFINEKHYSKSKSIILNSFSIIKYGPWNKKEYDFNPEQIFEILPIILNKIIIGIIIGILKGQPSRSFSFIRCYFHYALLFKKLSAEYDKQFGKYLNHKLNLIHKNKCHVNKSIIPNIKNFLVSLLFSNRDIYNEKMTKIWYSLYEEFVLRQKYFLYLITGGK